MLLQGIPEGGNRHTHLDAGRANETHMPARIQTQEKGEAHAKFRVRSTLSSQNATANERYELRNVRANMCITRHYYIDVYIYRHVDKWIDR